MATPATTTLTPINGHITESAFSLSTITASGTSGDISFDVIKTQGLLKQCDIALAGSGTATVSIFAKAGEATGSLHEIFKATSVTTSYHIADIDAYFHNADTTVSATLYIQVTETGGSQATGAITVKVWIEA